MIFYDNKSLSPHDNFTAVDNNRVVNISWCLLVLYEGKGMTIHRHLETIQQLPDRPTPHTHLVKMGSSHSSETKLHPLPCLRGLVLVRLTFLTLHSRLVIRGGSMERG